MPVRHQPSTLIIPETITISLSYSVLGDLCNTSDFCLWETRFEKIIRVLRRGKHGLRNLCEFSAAGNTVRETHASSPLRKNRLEKLIRVFHCGKLDWRYSSEFSAAGNSVGKAHPSSPVNQRETRSMKVTSSFPPAENSVEVLLTEFSACGKLESTFVHRVLRSGELEILRRTRCGELGIYPSQGWLSFLFFTYKFGGRNYGKGNRLWGPKEKCYDLRGHHTHLYDYYMNRHD